MSLRSIARQAKFVLPAVQVGAVQMRSKVTKAEEKPVAKKWRRFSKKVKNSEGDRESEKAKKDKKSEIASSGPVTARTLFVQKTMKGTKLTLKDVNTKWAALSTKERGVLEAEAAKNKAKRTAIRESLKKPPSAYAVFTKEHFPAEYTAALKSGLPRKEAFATATRAVAKKYRSQ